MLTSSKYTTIASFCPSVTPRLSPERRVTPLNGAHEVVRVAGDDLDSQFSFSWTPRFRAHRTARRVRPGIHRIRMVGCIVRGAFGRERCWLQDEHGVPSSRRKAVMLVQRDLTPIVDSDGEVHGEVVSITISAFGNGVRHPSAAVGEQQPITGGSSPGNPDPRSPHSATHRHK